MNLLNWVNSPCQVKWAERKNERKKLLDSFLIDFQMWAYPLHWIWVFGEGTAQFDCFLEKCCGYSGRGGGHLWCLHIWFAKECIGSFDRDMGGCKLHACHILEWQWKFKRCYDIPTTLNCLNYIFFKYFFLFFLFDVCVLYDNHIHIILYLASKHNLTIEGSISQLMLHIPCLSTVHTFTA